VSIPKQELYQQITEALVVGAEEMTIELTQEGLRQGLDPVNIINEGLVVGLDIISQEHETGLCFVPQMVTAIEIMQKIVTNLKGEIEKRSNARPALGKVVIGSVAGDIHTIGRDLVATMLAVNGFEVIDLGHNVPTWAFVKKAQEIRPPILGLSAFTTTTIQIQEDVIKALEEAGIREAVKVVIGGAATTQAWANEIGADGYGENAVQAVSVCTQMISG
jgi:trimethylamine corrinoid protein